MKSRHLNCRSFLSSSWELTEWDRRTGFFWLMSGWITRNRWWVKHTTKQPGINGSYPTLWPILLISLLLHAASCMFNVHDVCMFRISDKSLNTDQQIFGDSFPRMFMHWFPYARYVHEEIKISLKNTETRKDHHLFGFHWGQHTFGLKHP